VLVLALVLSALPLVTIVVAVLLLVLLVPLLRALLAASGIGPCLAGLCSVGVGLRGCRRSRWRWWWPLCWWRGRRRPLN